MLAGVVLDVKKTFNHFQQRSSAHFELAVVLFLRTAQLISITLYDKTQKVLNIYITPPQPPGLLYSTS